MAEFKYTPWELSSITEEVSSDDIEWGTPSPGLRYLRIAHASYNSGDGSYRIVFVDISDNIKFSVFNNTLAPMECDDQGNIIKPARPRTSVMNALISLGKALAGGPIGVPPTSSIIGGVVVADVKLVENKKNPEKPYVNIYHYDPAPRSIVEGFSELRDANGEIAQYCIEDIA